MDASLCRHEGCKSILSDALSVLLANIALSTNRSPQQVNLQLSLSVRSNEALIFGKHRKRLAGFLLIFLSCVETAMALNNRPIKIKSLLSKMSG